MVAKKNDLKAVFIRAVYISLKNIVNQVNILSSNIVPQRQYIPFRTDVK